MAVLQCVVHWLLDTAGSHQLLDVRRDLTVARGITRGIGALPNKIDYAFRHTIFTCGVDLRAPHVNTLALACCDQNAYRTQARLDDGFSAKIITRIEYRCSHLRTMQHHT